jgi:hypothetical protein
MRKNEIIFVPTKELLGIGSDVGSERDNLSIISGNKKPSQQKLKGFK